MKTDDGAGAPIDPIRSSLSVRQGESATTLADTDEAAERLIKLPLRGAAAPSPAHG